MQIQVDHRNRKEGLEKQEYTIKIVKEFWI